MERNIIWFKAKSYLPPFNKHAFPLFQWYQVEFYSHIKLSQNEEICLINLWNILWFDLITSTHAYNFSMTNMENIISLQSTFCLAKPQSKCNSCWKWQLFPDQMIKTAGAQVSLYLYWLIGTAWHLCMTNMTRFQEQYQVSTVSNDLRYFECPTEANFGPSVFL